MACFMMSMRVVSLVGLALATETEVSAGVHMLSRVSKKDMVPCSKNHVALWICFKVYRSLGKWSGNLS